MPRLIDSFPDVYKALLPDLFAREVPEETKATCASCSMCKETARDAVASVDGATRLFDKDTKCCTYHPRIPNYLVGGLLCDERPELAEGRSRMREKIARRTSVTPLWVSPPPRYQFLYNHARDAFGRAKSLRCPFYADETGGCTVWAYREAVCSTFFCRYVAAADGLKMWMTVKSYLTLVETQLARWIALQLDPEFVHDGADELRGMGDRIGLDELEDRRPDDAWYARAWRGYAGREEEYFVEAYRMAQGLTAADLEKILGLDGEILRERTTRAMTKALAPVLPAKLRLNPGLTLRHLADGSVAIGSYSEYDAVALPREVFDMLAEFRGDESVEAVRRRLRDEKGSDFADEILVALHQHKILEAHS